jgi:hypothetical protein
MQREATVLLKLTSDADIPNYDFKRTIENLKARFNVEVLLEPRWIKVAEPQDPES